MKRGIESAQHLTGAHWGSLGTTFKSTKMARQEARNGSSTILSPIEALISAAEAKMAEEADLVLPPPKIQTAEQIRDHFGDRRPPDITRKITGTPDPPFPEPAKC